MQLSEELNNRAGAQCELCSKTDNLNPFLVPAASDESVDSHVLLCSNCQEQIENADLVNVNHWRCLNDSMWSAVPAVQVLAWRMLYRLRAEGWPQDLLDMMYLEDDTLNWAKATELHSETETVQHKDANGNILEAGDTVTLIKDLNVKGANFIAKRGTAVRRISLVKDNSAHIEGKVNGQQIVILTQYIKKQK